ncbi:MBL fold metallo-hydrolase [Bdellovibrionota bacterium FG-2]
MIEEKLEVGPFQQNCRILACPVTGEAVVVDPGDNAPEIVGRLVRLKTKDGKSLNVKMLLHTHAHLDHVGGTRALKELLQPGCQPLIALHPDAHAMYLELASQSKFFGLKYGTPLPVDRFLKDGEIFAVGTLEFRVIHTPGHSPGGVCFHVVEKSPAGTPSSELLLSGDTLFQGSIGRTDLMGGDYAQLISSVKKRLLPLEGSLRVCSGHGPDTTIGEEREHNPFLR